MTQTRSSALALMLCLAVAAAAPGGSPGTAAGSPDIRVEADAQVGGSLPLAYSEPHLAVDPDDPDHLLVASIVGFTREPDHSAWKCAIMLSRDGGASWSERQMDLGRCADPWLALRGKDAWFASLHDLSGGGRGLAVHRSSDGGASWDPEPFVVGRGHDHPTLALDRRGGVYVVSAYGARRTSHVSIVPLEVPGLPPEPVRRPLSLISNTYEPVVTGNGQLVIPFGGFSRFVGRRQERIEPPRVEAIVFHPDTPTLGEPHPLTGRCGSRKGFPGSAIDESDGPFNQRIYLACVSLRGADLLVISSDDGGATWGTPVQVLGTADPDVEGNPLRRSVGIAVSGRGTVGVVWQDRGSDPDRRCQVERFAVSVDGGASFSSPVDLSARPSCPGTGRRNAAAAAQWPAGGDYGAVVGLSDGRFRAVWADARTGIFQVRTAIVSVR